ncbi:NEQ150 [Nanoarchaeum equitans Kin4-M]|uniref:DNA-binding protein NEQ150 n=1 Tax=Nanoarchaeum equitans (strain Kin4-M) TaxID=228908 RepID=Y150_NANEQ|nr:RecName: Full=DNA-binding protein NEQ150 [Nanoarchaeum equitans Kin4-M]AAR39004.1 NEQ150 [Nanoarchaeum equitans Kin4-M]
MDLEEIRKKKLEELKKEEAKRKLLEQLESNVMQYLTSEAKQRLYNIKMAHPEKYELALQILYRVIQQTPTIIDDTTLKKLLAKLFQKREPKIRFIRK